MSLARGLEHVCAVIGAVVVIMATLAWCLPYGWLDREDAEDATR